MASKKKLPRGIRRLPSGRYQVRVVLDGKRVSETFASEESARKFVEFADDDRRLKKHGHQGLYTPRRQLVEIVRRFLEESDRRAVAGTLGQDTNITYFQLTRGLLLWLEASGRIALYADQFDDTLVKSYMDWRLSRTLTEKAYRKPTGLIVRKELALLSRIYKWAGVKRAWEIPSSKILPRRGDGKRVLAPEQFFAYIESMEFGTLERTYAETAITTGLRGCDLRNLDVDSVNLERREISGVALKTGKRFLLPFEEDLETHLRAWLARRLSTVGHRKLFHLDGRPLQRDTLRRRFHHASVAAGINPPMDRLGSARNAFIAWLLENGVDPYAVAQYAGHGDLRTTQDYARAYRPLKSLKLVAQKIQQIRRGA